MKKNIKILYILLLVCTVILPFKVRAAIESDYNISTGNFSNGGGGGSSNTYKGSYPNFQLKGVRITLVDNNGDKIGKTINFFCNKDASLDWTNVNYVAGNKTIKEIKASDNVDIKTSNRIASIPGGINTYFNDQLCTSNLDWTAFSNRIIELSNGINNENTNAYKFFQKFGKSFDEEKVLNWYYMIEPIIVIGVDHNGLRVCTAWGTSAEFAKYRDALLPCSADNNNAHKTWLAWSKNAYIKYNRSDNGVTYFGTGNIRSSFTDKFSNGNYVGLVWLGKNAKTSTTCSQLCSKSTYKEYLTSANKTCSSDKGSTSISINASREEFFSKCTITEYFCETGPKKGTKISKEIYSTKGQSKGRYSDIPYDQACYNRPSCSNFYMTSEKFDSVKLYPEATSTTNCCQIYENSSSNVNQLYRDHPECYKCDYNETRINPTCSTNKNKATAGYTFTRTLSNNRTVTADTYTCISKSANGETENASTNLFTKKVVNQYCKVICSETVSLEFPFLNNGNSVKYLTRNSIFSWPKKNNDSDDELKLKAKGIMTCWYHVNLVKLYKLFESNSSSATKIFNKCVEDMNESVNDPKNILNEQYNLSGNYKVKYTDDSEYVELTKERTSNNASYTKESGSTVSLSASKNNVIKLVRTAEGLKFKVEDAANYIISNTGANSGYLYSYNGKYYKNKVGISNINSNNILEIEPSLAFNGKSVSGNVSIIYSNVGGTGSKFITTEQEYKNSGGTDLNNNRCVYKKIDNGKEYLCPDETKNKGMNLKNYMTTESLTYDEAVEKYCNESNDMTVCPSDSYYPNKAITKTCYNDENCLKLTCYRYTCTDDDGCHELNDCIARQIKDYNKSFDEAKKICTNNNCNEKGGNSGNIEYRVIDLKDPFPGNAAKAGSSLFNTNIKGRKPGSNWNSTTVVQKEILKNRGVNGDAIYGLEPLYVFELTPKVIDEIRKYNDKHSYDDFTLSCKGENKQACVASGFDFKKNYGVVAVNSNCSSINDLDSFNRCYNS